MDEQNSMDGTIRINGELKPMMPYGCWSDAEILRCSPMVSHGNGGEGSPFWPNVMSSLCRYDRSANDERCRGCNVIKDIEYVEGLNAANNN